jgi:hypothetical protein
MGKYTNLVESVKNWFLSNRFWGPIIAIFMVSSAVKTAFETTIYFTSLPSKHHTPILKVAFAENDKISAQKSVSPAWSNDGYVGFSDPVSIKLAVINEGKKQATNVEVYILYSSTYALINKTKGEDVPYGFLSSHQKVSLGDRVSSYSISHLNSSNIPHLLDSTVQLQLRFREVIGIAFSEDNLPVIQRMYMDFKDENVGSEGIFPLHYLITCDELEKPITGTISLRIPTEKIAIYKQKLNDRTSHELNYEGEVDMSGIISDAILAKTASKEIDLYCEGSTNAVHAKIYDLQSETNAMLCMIVDDQFLYAEADENLNGFVESIYVGTLASSEKAIRTRTQKPVESLTSLQVFGTGMEGMNSYIRRQLLHEPQKNN